MSRRLAPHFGGVGHLVGVGQVVLADADGLVGPGNDRSQIGLGQLDGRAEQHDLAVLDAPGAGPAIESDRDQ